MVKKIKVLAVDDDPTSIELIQRYLDKSTFNLKTLNSAVDALPAIIKFKPDCIICDLMMPKMDGIEFCKQIKSNPDLADILFIIVSSKDYEADKTRARNAGADGYLVKSMKHEDFIKALTRLLTDHIRVTFWGVRGSLPAPGKENQEFGGNTSCVSIEFPKGELIILDAGTGIRSLGNALIHRHKGTGITGKILITHPHWDHINAINFFAPLYVRGNDFEICGPAQGALGMEDLVNRQMDSIFFPVETKEFGANIKYRNLGEEEFTYNDIHIKTKLLNHPGFCLGYRIEYHDKTICYISDNELYPENEEKYNDHYFQSLVKFISKCDVLIIDCAYSDDEYTKKMGWGHSATSEVIKLAHNAKVKKLYLFHHDVNQDDTKVHAKLASAVQKLTKLKSSVVCFAAKENTVIQV